MDGPPSFLSMFIAIGVVARRVEDGYADFAVQVNCARVRSQSTVNVEMWWTPRVNVNMQVSALFGCQISVVNCIFGGIFG